MLTVKLHSYSFSIMHFFFYSEKVSEVDMEAALHL